jgi:hypothetical protein
VFGNGAGEGFCNKGHEVAGGWEKLCKEELHNFYSSPNVIKMVKSVRMRRVRHWYSWIANNELIAVIGHNCDKKCMQIFCLEILKGKYLLEYLGIGDEWIILKWLLKNGLGGVDWIHVAHYGDTSGRLL